MLTKRTNIAIIVACLASFRSLFVQKDTRHPHLPVHRAKHGSSNLFLRGGRKVRPSSHSQSTIPAMGIFNFVRARSSNLASVVSKPSFVQNLTPLNGVMVTQEIGLSHTDWQGDEQQGRRTWENITMMPAMNRISSPTQK